MNRRDFLHALGAIAAINLPAEGLAGMLSDEGSVSTGAGLFGKSSPDLARSNDLRVGIVCIGGAACCMLPKIFEQLPAELISLTQTLAIDTSPRALRYSRGQRQILIHAGPRLDNLQSPVILTNVERTTIEQAVAGLHLVVILAGMGGTAGSGLTPAVADITHQLGMATVVAAIMPFEWEATARNNKARDAYEGMLTHRKADAIFQFRNDTFAHISGGDAQLRSVLNQPPTQFSSLYRNLVTPIAAQGLVGFDLEDLRYILSRPGLAACAEATSRSENAAAETCAAAITQPWLGADRLRSASAVLVNIETNGYDMALKGFNDVALFMREQCAGDVELFFTMNRREMPAGQFRVSVLASGIG